MAGKIILFPTHEEYCTSCVYWDSEEEFCLLHESSLQKATEMETFWEEKMYCRERREDQWMEQERAGSADR